MVFPSPPPTHPPFPHSPALTPTSGAEWGQAAYKGNNNNLHTGIFRQGSRDTRHRGTRNKGPGLLGSAQTIQGLWDPRTQGFLLAAHSAARGCGSGPRDHWGGAKAGIIEQTRLTKNNMFSLVLSEGRGVIPNIHTKQLEKILLESPRRGMELMIPTTTHQGREKN